MPRGSRLAENHRRMAVAPRSRSESCARYSRAVQLPPAPCTTSSSSAPAKRRASSAAGDAAGQARGGAVANLQGATLPMTAVTRHIVLCYKIHFRLRRLVNDIVDKGPNRYGYMGRARSLLWALLCQGTLNDPKLPDLGLLARMRLAPCSGRPRCGHRLDLLGRYADLQIL
jgi:hypothetical protein